MIGPKQGRLGRARASFRILGILGSALMLAASSHSIAEGPAASGAPRVDRHGDPLPSGAIARIGSARFQHGLGINRVAYSPDGKLLASSSYKMVRIWDPKTGRERSHITPFGYQYAPAFSPDAKSIAAIDMKTVQNAPSMWSVGVWDTATGLKLRQTASVSSQLNNLVYSPDGGTIAANLWHTPTTATTLVFDAVTMALRHQIKPVRGAPVSALGFANEGKSLVVLENDTGEGGEGDLRRQTGTIYLYDVNSGKRSKIIRAASIFSGYDPAFSRDGSMIAVILDDGTISVIDLKSGRERQHLKPNYGKARVRLAFSPDGKTLASGSQPLRTPTDVPTARMHIRLWDLETGKAPRQLSYPARIGDGGITGLSFSADGKTLASSSDESFVRLWDLETVTQAYPGPEAPYLLGPMAFTADAEGLIVGGLDGSLGRWDPRTGARAWQANVSPGRIVRLFAPANGTTVLPWTGVDPQELRDTATGKAAGRLPASLRPDGNPADLSPDGKRLLVGFPPRQVFEVETGKQLAMLPDHADAPFVVQGIPVQELAVEVGGIGIAMPVAPNPPEPGGNFIEGADVEAVPGAPAPPFPPQPGANVIDGVGANADAVPARAPGIVVEEAPQNRRFIINNIPGQPARVVELLENGMRIVGPLSARFMPDGKTILADYGSCLMVCDAATGKPSRRIEVALPSPPNEVGRPLVVSQDGSRLAVWDDEIRLLDLADGREVARFNPPGPDAIGGVAFSPDGKLLAAFAAGRTPPNQPDLAEGSTIWIWEVASRQLLGRIEDPHRGKVDQILFAPDGKLLASSSASDSTILIWDMAEILRRAGGVSPLSSIDGKKTGG